MRLLLKKWTVEALKVLIVAGCFIIIQHQIIALHMEMAGVSGNFASALGRYQGDFNETREELESVVENSHQNLRNIEENLQKSTTSLKDERDHLSRHIARTEEQLNQSIDVKFTRYTGKLEQILDQSNRHDLRLKTVEEKVGQVLRHDSRLMEESIVLPIIQLKGEGTVGSGVLVYSEPRPQRERAMGVGKRASKKKGPSKSRGTPHSTFAITACHVAMEILGRGFPAGVLDDIQVLDPSRRGYMKKYSAKIEIFDEDRDLALLRLMTTAKFPHVARSLSVDERSHLRLFSRIYAVGCPLGNSPLPSYGEISSCRKVVGKQNFWMINAPTYFGNSGGGVFLAETCELIGISSMIYTYGKSRPVVVPHMGLFVPIGEVCVWLESEGYDFIFEGSPEVIKTPTPATLRTTTKR